jgi:hypothetical protein
MREAARFYELAAEEGITDAMLSLGLFHWCGLGGLTVNQDEARRYWARAGFDAIAPRFTLDAADSVSCIRSERDAWIRDPHRPPVGESCFELEDDEDRSISDRRDDRFLSASTETEFALSPSFEFWNADCLRSIESVVLFDGHRPVRDLLLSSHRPPASILSLLIAEGILREGNRCLHSPRDATNAQIMFNELKDCCDIGSILRLCANFYTRATFLYRCVNKFMRETGNRDEETGRNIGIYVGFLRECFCVQSSLNPLEWSRPRHLYRGADFPTGVLVDYARRQGEKIWWQGFTSASANIDVARRFEGNVLFEIVLNESAASLSQYSNFPDEEEFILNPYQRFTLDAIQWNDSLNRWTIRLFGRPSPDPISWFGEPATTTGGSPA